MKSFDDESMDRGIYRMVLRPEGDDWHKSLIDETQTWLRTKGIDLDLTRDARYSSPERTLTANHHKNATASAFRLEMTETGENGRFTTSILGINEPDDPWLMIRVANDRRMTIPSPRLARNMLERASLRDGGHILHRAPEMIYPGTLDAFQSRLMDPDRRGAIFALGTSEGLPPKVLFDKHSSWFRDTIGMAEVCILTPEATEAFPETAGGLQVSPGTIRTFAPGIDGLDDASTHRRHRVLGTTRLLEDPDWRLRQLLGLFARRYVTSTPVPASIYRWNRTFDRLRNTALLDRLSATKRTPLPPRSTAAAGDELERVRTTLGLPDLKEDTLLKLAEDATNPADPAAIEEQKTILNSLQERKDALEDEAASLRQESLAYQDEAAEAGARARNAEEQLRRINSTLYSHNIDIWTLDAKQEHEAISPHQPDSWEQLHEQRGEWENYGVIITADQSPMVYMDEIDLDGRALYAAFDALRALSGYVLSRRSGQHDGDLKSYLLDPPPGRPTYQANRFVQTETGYTKRSYGDERIFPVPTWVDSTGSLAMYPHLRLTKVPNRDPRIHFVEAIKENVGLYAIVGYIGTHLTNRSTSKLN